MLSLGLLTASGLLYFLGLVGYDLWPLAFVAFVPALWTLDTRHGPALSRKQLLLGATWMGLVTMAGGYYWLVTTLEHYSGFPFLVCVAMASVVWVYQGGSLALTLWLTSRGLSRGWQAPLCLAAGVAASELCYPQLFGWYLGNALHNLPLAIQAADLGGPILISLPIAWTNGVLYEALRAHRAGNSQPRRLWQSSLAIWLIILSYGAYRIHEVDARVADSPRLRVGLIQTNMGLLEKRSDVGESIRRHQAQSLALERRKDLDLLVWPESAYGYYIPEQVHNVRRMVLGKVETPTLFGALAIREHGDDEQRFNTAFLADKKGELLGSYDKTYLLAFGEYIPFGDRFPELYDYSPHSGHFTPGNHTRPLVLDGKRLAVLLCYEDILPGFVRQFVAGSNPHLLVNITNDAWFGDTVEPWQHLALAKFRAVEHHRSLVRATNSGVSAAVDPVGRVLTAGGVFKRESLNASVPLLQEQSLYSHVGDWPGYLGLLAALGFAFGPRRTTRTE